MERLNISNVRNYAYGGATTDNALVIGYIIRNSISVPGVRQQISTYVNTSDFSRIDFSRTNIDAAIVAVSLCNGINELIRIGARKFLHFKSILL